MKILPTKTVASVMATFNKTMTELESVATANEQAAETLTTQKAEIESKIAMANAEATKARSIRGRLGSIMGEDE